MSTIPAVRAALKSLLTITLAPLNVQVIDGSPVAVTTLIGNVLVIGAMGGTRSAGSQNRIRTTTRNIPFDTSQDEYTIEIIISVSRSGSGELTDVIETADDIYDAARIAIEDSVDPSGVVEMLPTGQFSIEPISDSNGRYVTMNFGVDVTARD